MGTERALCLLTANSPGGGVPSYNRNCYVDITFRQRCSSNDAPMDGEDTGIESHSEFALNS